MHQLVIARVLSIHTKVGSRANPPLSRAPEERRLTPSSGAFSTHSMAQKMTPFLPEQ